MEFSEKFSLYKVFSSHMVLQRGKEIVISGQALPGKTVRAAFAGQEVLATADGKGEWYAAFPAMTAGGPYTLTVSGAAGTEPIEYDDILIGDVWFCSGQSNMEMPVGGPNPYFRAGDYEETLADADRPQIRLYQSEKRISPHTPNPEETSKWVVCSRETLELFSACAFFFGDQYQKDNKVPVGLISCNWGGTRIEPWISPEKFQKSGIQPYYETPETQKHLREMMLASSAFAEMPKWCAKFDQFCGQPAPEELECDFDDSAWSEWSNPVLPGRYLYRYTFDMPEELADKDIEVELGAVNDTDKTFCNGKFIGSIDIYTPGYWSAFRSYPMRGHKGKNCIAILVDNHYSNGSAPAANALKLRDGDKTILLETQCRYRVIRHLGDDFPIRPNVPSNGISRNEATPQYPGTLFNGMVYPWLRYKIAGFLWYQGCSNNGEHLYYQMHKLLIDDWREQWGDENLPFLIVQLASFHEQTPEERLSDEFLNSLPFPEFSAYGLIREIQFEMPKVRKNVGTIVAFDRGDHSDIHPRDKKTLGIRLAKKANQILFGSKEICDGPEFIGYRQERDHVRIFFKNTGSGLTTTDGQPPKGFAFGTSAGSLCKSADAVIEGNTVVLRDAIDPQRVRYAFTGYCEVNLCNKEGFPAVPFRSDKVDYSYMDADDIDLIKIVDTADEAMAYLLECHKYGPRGTVIEG